jgi:hypothetical protein
MTSPLSFDHTPSTLFENTDVAVAWDPVANLYKITVTLKTTATAIGQLVMWYNDPCSPIFSSGGSNPPKALLPVTGYGNVGEAQSTPSNVSLWVQATPAAPAQFVLGWAIPSNLASSNVGFFFQAVDANYQGAPRTFAPGDALNAQYNVQVDLGLARKAA